MPVSVGDARGLAGIPGVAASELCVEAGNIPLLLQGEGVLHRKLRGSWVAIVVPGVEYIARSLDVKQGQLTSGRFLFPYKMAHQDIKKMLFLP